MAIKKRGVCLALISRIDCTLKCAAVSCGSCSRYHKKHDNHLLWYNQLDTKKYYITHKQKNQPKSEAFASLLCRYYFWLNCLLIRPNRCNLQTGIGFCRYLFACSRILLYKQYQYLLWHCKHKHKIYGHLL